MLCQGAIDAVRLLLNSIRRIAAEGYGTPLDDDECAALLNLAGDSGDWPEFAEAVHAVRAKIEPIDLSFRPVTLDQLKDSAGECACIIVLSIRQAAPRLRLNGPLLLLSANQRTRRGCSRD